MNSTVYIVLCVVLIQFNIIHSSGFFARSDEYHEDTRKYMFMADGENKLHFVKLTPDPDSVEPKFDAQKDVIFNLYTRKNPDEPQILIPENMTSILTSNFDPKNPTRITCHGWRTGPTAGFNVNTRKAYLENGDFNVIVIDWYSGASTINYISARNRVFPVAERIFQFVEIMVKNSKIHLHDLHLVGHSLGAHVVGLIGRHVTKNLHDKIHTVIGLDPASPLFSLEKEEERISTDSGHYVEIIHTNGGTLAFSNPLGHADFYPNGGMKQPGCGLDFAGTCSHSRSSQLFIETFLPGTFVSYNCLNYEEISKDKKCTVINKMAKMGTENGAISNNGRAKGIYLNKTNKESPYSQVPDENATEIEI
uniref:Putative pancreatic lipase-like enzyme n=1 Tax=Xenopsylla cheopis TaxID=163159 RepID=A0A6M2E0G1_XENCH